MGETGGLMLVLTYLGLTLGLFVVLLLIAKSIFLITVRFNALRDIRSLLIGIAGKLDVEKSFFPPPYNQPQQNKN